jgi:hypothetical protein
VRSQNRVVGTWTTEEPRFDYRKGQEILLNIQVWWDVMSRALRNFEEVCRGIFEDTVQKTALREKDKFEKFLKIRNNSPLPPK